jgi:hypothetical protein
MTSRLYLRQVVAAKLPKDLFFTVGQSTTLMMTITSVGEFCYLQTFPVTHDYIRTPNAGRHVHSRGIDCTSVLAPRGRSRSILNV